VELPKEEETPAENIAQPDAKNPVDKAGKADKNAAKTETPAELKNAA
jgi:hypothetical protein